MNEIKQLNNFGVVVNMVLIAFALESIATQGDQTPTGHQILFWVAFLFGVFALVTLLKMRPQRDLLKIFAVVARRKIRRLL